MTTLKIHSPTTISSMWQRIRRGRTYLLVLVGIIALLAVSVAIGQASQDYDLACRSVFTASGATSTGGTITGGNYGTIAALGMPIVPPAEANPPTYAIRSTIYAIRSGFPPGPPSTNAFTAESPSLIDQVKSLTRLPIIFGIGRIVRGGC